MLKFEAFNLPTDGLTRVSPIGHYNNRYEAEGWSLVGMCEAQSEDDPKASLYGVYRLSGDAALIACAKAQAEAEKKAADAASKLYSAEQELKTTQRALAQASTDRERLQKLEALAARAAERFGAAFRELEAEL